MHQFRYTPLPTAEKVSACEAPLIAIVGPWGSGKSTIAAIDLYEHCLRYQCDALVVRDTYPALRDSCVRKFMEIFREAGDLHAGPPPTFHWHGQLQGRQVMFRSAESAEDIHKFGSVEVGYAWLEEVCPGLLPGGSVNVGMAPEVLAGVIGRVRAWGVPSGKRRILLTSLPPPTTRHWFHVLFYDRRPMLKLAEKETELTHVLETQVALFRLDPAENASHLPLGYYATNLAFLTSEDQVDRFIKGEVGAGYGASGVYAQQWQDQQHIADVHPVDGPFLVGIDGGLDASAVILQPQESGRLYVLDEVCTHGLGLEDFGLVLQQRIASRFGIRSLTCWADPAIFARGQTLAKDGAWYLDQVGIKARRAPQDPDVRISAVRTWLSRMGSDGPLLQVHPRCELLIEGFRGAYHFKRAAGDILEKVDKNEFSHVHDALQYALAPTAYQSMTTRPLPPLPSPDYLGMVRPPFSPRRGFSRRAH